MKLLPKCRPFVVSGGDLIAVDSDRMGLLVVSPAGTASSLFIVAMNCVGQFQDQKTSLQANGS